MARFKIIKNTPPFQIGNIVGGYVDNSMSETGVKATNAIIWAIVLKVPDVKAK